MTLNSAAQLRALFMPGAETPFTLTGTGTLSLHFDFGAVQSRMALDDPDKLVLAYTRTMMGALLFNPWPRHIAMIGLGGGSLIKYCYRHLPWARINVAEIDARVIAMRQKFHVPPDDERLSIHHMDGADFVRTEDLGKPDLLLVDGFDTSGISPALSSMRFYDDCRALLAEDGVLAVNLSTVELGHELCIDRLQKCFDDRIVVIRTDDCFNKIVFALNSEKLPGASSLLAAAEELAWQPLPFRQFANRIITSYRGQHFLIHRRSPTSP